ncbi:DUF1877 domain-containing protein [Streptomyces sp. NPDC051636]|uniref:DUF1877 domain-containing protein n=1 Tax=Streptomyces sp. NPDC051636 TaxID=3365663 RepID=UPI00379461D1
MTMSFHLRAVPPGELRDDVPSLERLFQDDWETVRGRIGLRREQVLDQRYLDHELLYAGSPPHLAADGPRAQVVLGGRPVFHSSLGLPPFLLLTAPETAAVAAFLTSSDFEALWRQSRDDLLPRYGGPATEPRTHGTFAAAHRDLTQFYAHASASGDAVVKWLVL